MITAPPKISVCMATFNGANYLFDQILSILKQLRPGDELIISDNGSTDESLNIIREFNDNRIKLLHCKTVGVVQNFQNALQSASGEYIFLSDQDDIWMPGRVEIMVEMLRTSHMVMGNAVITNEDLNPDIHGYTLFELTKPSKYFLKNIVKNTFTGCCMAFDRDLLRAALPVPSNIPMHDWWIGLMAIWIGEISFLDSPCLFYRRHNNNVSTLSMPSKNSFFYRFLMRITMLNSMFLRIAILPFRKLIVSAR